jgi:hypothetical protein
MEDPVKVALDNLELIVANMTTIMKNVPNVELLTKIQVSGEAGKALKALSTLRTALAGGNVSEVKEDQGPDPDRPAINMQEAIEIRNMNSARIKRAVFDINNARNILSSIIPGPDKAITALNRPNHEGMEVRNSFRGTKETLILVVTTNGGAHVVTCSNEGIYSLTHAGYWELPEFKSTQAVADPVEYKDGKFVPSTTAT